MKYKNALTQNRWILVKLNFTKYKYMKTLREFKDVLSLQLLRPVWFLKPGEFYRPVKPAKKV